MMVALLMSVCWMAVCPGSESGCFVRDKTAHSSQRAQWLKF